MKNERWRIVVKKNWITALIVLSCFLVFFSLVDIAPYQSKSARTESEMFRVAIRVYRYYSENNKLPSSLKELPEPKDMHKASITDAWGREFIYKIKESNLIELISYGGSGKTDAKDLIKSEFILIKDEGPFHVSNSTSISAPKLSDVKILAEVLSAKPFQSNETIQIKRWLVELRVLQIMNGSPEINLNDKVTVQVHSVVKTFREEAELIKGKKYCLCYLNAFSKNYNGDIAVVQDP
jgi:hypothetical protein